MGYRDFDAFGGTSGINNDLSTSANNKTVITVDDASDTVDAPSFVKDADFARDGMDLILADKGGAQTLVIEGYFAQTEAPTIIDADGAQFSPALVQSFLKATPTFASAETMSDVSPVGAVHEISGDATVTRTNGMTEPLKLGTPIYQGDIVETNETGAVNIMFIDETSMAISEDARLAIDEYVFDPASSGGVSNFSVLKGIFVYTSGLIGREDPDDVMIETPIGSIGIRGTIIAADVDSGEVTVVEGAIVLRDAAGNEMTLASQYETAKFNAETGTIDNLGQLSPEEVAEKFAAVSGVAGELFSSVNDNAAANNQTQPQQSGEQPSQEDSSGAAGTVDQNNDGNVDGTLEGATDGGNDESAQPDQQQQNDKESFNETTFGTENTLEASRSNISGTSSPTTSGTSTTTAGTSTATASSGTSTITAKSTTDSRSEALDPAVTNQPRETNTSNGSGGTTTPPPSVFTVTATAMPSILEGQAGVAVANISSTNGNIYNVSFNGPFAALFEYNPTDSTSGVIRLRSGFDLDFETFNFLNLQYQVTSMDLSVANGIVPITVQNQNIGEALYQANIASSVAMSAIENSNWSYDFRNDFAHENFGSTLTFSYEISIDGGTTFTPLTAAGAPSIYAGTTSVNPNGVLDIFFNSSGVTQTNFLLNVTGTDVNSNTISYDYSFTLYGNRIPNTTNTITSNGSNIFSDHVGTTLSIDGINNNIFVSNSFTGNITVQGEENIIQGGAGTLQITIDSSAMYNTISGGSSSNVFHISNSENRLYGDGGNDTFIFLNNAAYNTFAASSYALIDGGGERIGAQRFAINFGQQTHLGLGAQSFTGHGDKISFTFDGSMGIDLSGISDKVSGIEILNFRDGFSDNVTLSYNDIISMTDSRNTLVIRGNVGDQLDVNALGFGDLISGTQITDLADGTQYDSFFIGEVTLLVDVNISTAIN
jgi:hypothetical protein